MTDVGIVMGSDSDWPVMSAAAEALAEFGVPFEKDVVSAHRMPEEMIAYGRSAHERGLKVIIAGAGGAAHLPGMLAVRHDAARHRGARAAQVPRRHGLAAVDRADAGGRAGGDRVDRRARATRACSPCACSAWPTPRCARRWLAFQDELRATATRKGDALRELVSALVLAQPRGSGPP